VEFTVVMPCLNEAETLGRCISKSFESFRKLGIDGEVLVADNGSTDGSQKLASDLGARVVPVPARGYGNALRGGIEVARGRYVIMGDSDDSYDFSELGGFVERLRGGDDLVMGNRFKGGIRPGAMPWKHRYLGNPVLSALGRLFFRSPVGDFHCGLRGFSREAYGRMDLRTTGMEFASEMVIKSTVLGLRISEVPVVLHKDGRSRPPHLRSWRDGWRHLRFMLLFSPLWLFLIPGFCLLLAGLVVGGWLLGGPRETGRVVLDIHTLLASAMVVSVGYQLVTFGLFTKAYVVSQGLHPPSTILERLGRWVTLEAGLVAGLVLAGGGLACGLLAVNRWRLVGFGSLDVQRTMRIMIPACLLLTLGVQTLFTSFFLGVLRLGLRPGGSGKAAGGDPPTAP
jgi:hypothetical protein